MAFLGATAYAGYLYVPVAFNASTYKDLMQHYTDLAATSSKSPSWAGEQLLKSAPSTRFQRMPSSRLCSEITGSRCEVQYVRVIEFPGYSYNYEFDHTVKSTAFCLSSKT
jgi:hypothetical protein